MLALDVKIIGINNRNLKTFEVNLDTTKKLCDMVTPQMRVAGKVLVSESGVSDTDDIKVLAKSHADALLIGTVLMEAVKPQELIAEFKGVYDNEYDKTELIDQNGLTEVKICGITSMVDVNLLIKYGADYGGMVVFTVSPDEEQILKIQDKGFDYVQIHGELSENVYNLCKLPIIRAVNISQDDTDSVKKSIESATAMDKVVGILLDAGIPGSGKTFDWDSVKELELKEKKLFLAGGLNSSNVAAAIKCVEPDVVDISSGVEYDDVLIKGKDEQKVKEFICNARAAK